MSSLIKFLRKPNISNPNRHTDPADGIAADLANLYCSHIWRQPLSLFDPLTLEADRLPKHVRLLLTALTTRFTDSGRDVSNLVDKGRRELMSRIADGCEDEQVVQSLCLLGLLDIACRFKHRSTFAICL